MGVLACTDGVGSRALGVDTADSEGAMGRKGGEDSRSRGEISSLGFLAGGSKMSRSSYSIILSIVGNCKPILPVYIRVIYSSGQKGSNKK